MAVNLGAGSNKLTLAAGGNTATVSNTNTLIGGSGADAITLGAAVSNGSIDLGAGSDTLTLANATNSATVSQRRDHHRRIRQRHRHPRQCASLPPCQSIWAPAATS